MKTSRQKQNKRDNIKEFFKVFFIVSLITFGIFGLASLIANGDHESKRVSDSIKEADSIVATDTTAIIDTTKVNVPADTGVVSKDTAINTEHTKIVIRVKRRPK